MKSFLSLKDPFLPRAKVEKCRPSGFLHLTPRTCDSYMRQVMQVGFAFLQILVPRFPILIVLMGSRFGYVNLRLKVSA